MDTMRKQMALYAHPQTDAANIDRMRYAMQRYYNSYQPAVHIAFLLFLVLCIFSASGCQQPVTTWSAEVRSPDGLWLAVAQSRQWSGPGTAYDATIVSLKPLKGRQSPMEILDFSHQYATMNLEMNWITATHLNIVYGPSSRPGDQVSVTFQVARYAGIEISIEPLASKESSGSQQLHNSKT
ncbi:MAG: hypothetical protein KGQ73_05935 [Gammaproteobacteria bacterium]|nr:hypothetical protein [Gammaproteobacteria bacterium]